MKYSWIRFIFESPPRRYRFQYSKCTKESTEIGIVFSTTTMTLDYDQSTVYPTILVHTVFAMIFLR